MLTTLLAPVTIMNKLLFIALMIWTMFLILKIRQPRLMMLFPAIVVITIFLYGLLISLLGRSDSTLAVQFFLATFMLILIYFVCHYSIDMDKASELCGKAMLAFTILFWFLAFNKDLPYATRAFEWMNEMSLSAYAEREFIEGGITMTLALGTAPFLFVPWCIVTVRLIRFPRTADLLWFLAYGLAIGLSGARGLIVVALAFLIAALFWLTSFRTRIFIVLAAAVIFAIIAPMVLNETMIFSSKEVSNSIKIGHFNSFLDALDISGALFGKGLGSYYFSAGRGDWAAHTELTPIDLARYVGIPMAIFVYVLMLFPTCRLVKYKGDNFLFSFAFFLFLILSITNPTLFNSYGMLVVVWYWAKISRTVRTPLTNKMRQPLKTNEQPLSLAKA
jgi:hypothetical protein